MSEQSTFNTLKGGHIKKLEFYVPVVARVHGESHAEFHEVRKVFDEITKKIKAGGVEKPALHMEFARLREITDDYTVPGDVCETYEAVYGMLAELDKAYHA